jgi:hypothetical protein
MLLLVFSMSSLRPPGTRAVVESIFERVFRRSEPDARVCGVVDAVVCE